MNCLETIYGRLDLLLEDDYNLVFIDRNCDFDEIPKIMQDCVGKNSFNPVWEMDYWADARWECMAEEVNKIMDKYEELYGDDDFDFYKDEIREFLQEQIYDRDVSDPDMDCLKNTRKWHFCYDLNLSVDDWYTLDSKERSALVRKIARKVKAGKEHYAVIREMLENSQDGCLLVFFHSDLEEVITKDSDNDFQSVTFKNPVIAVVDYVQGSGYNCTLEGVEFTVPFDRNGLRIDNAITYSYTDAICGMIDEWCDSTEVKFSFDKVGRRPKNGSVLQQQCDEEAQYIANFKAGKCSFYDANITRHRDTFYRNEPMSCGRVCPHCGRIWLD